MNLKSKGALALTVGLTTALIGGPLTVIAQEDANDSKGTIAYVPQTSFAGSTSLAHYKGIQDTAEALGYDLAVNDPNFDAAKQNAIVENFITQEDIVGIIMQPIDGYAVSAAVEKANAAGIPVLGNVGEILGAETLFSTTMDLSLVGSIPAEAMVEALVEKYGEPRGLVVMIGGPLTDTISQGRLDGMNSVFDQYPDIEVIHRPSDWEIPKAESALLDLLTAYPEADGLISASDYLNDGLVAAMKQADRYKKIGEEGHLIWTSVDGMPDGLKQIREGYMELTSDCNCEVISVFNVHALDDYLSGRPLPSVGDVIEEEGTTWTPGIVYDGASGPVLRLTPYKITAETVDHPGLWGNNDYIVDGDRVEISGEE